jgi:lysine biosynthesis protein LysW
MAKCPKCNYEIQPNPELYEGEIVTCPSCGKKLEVVSVEPMELQVVEEN